MSDRTIHIRACVFGGRYVVTVEPRTIDRPSIECLTIVLARDAARNLSDETRWPVIDDTGEDDHG
ncbi:MAG: hypothetical protein ABW184_09975 [Sphingobium sp.]